MLSFFVLIRGVFSCFHSNNFSWFALTVIFSRKTAPSYSWTLAFTAKSTYLNTSILFSICIPKVPHIDLRILNCIIFEFTDYFLSPFLHIYNKTLRTILYFVRFFLWQCINYPDTWRSRFWRPLGNDLPHNKMTIPNLLKNILSQLFLPKISMFLLSVRLEDIAYNEHFESIWLNG